MACCGSRSLDGDISFSAIDDIDCSIRDLELLARDWPIAVEPPTSAISFL
jgi:hypothetical protein